MKPIIGEVTYLDMSPEELARLTREAEIMRAEAMRAFFARAAHRIAALFGAGARKLTANPGVHPNAGAR